MLSLPLLLLLHPLQLLRLFRSSRFPRPEWFSSLVCAAAATAAATITIPRCTRLALCLHMRRPGKAPVSMVSSVGRQTVSSSAASAALPNFNLHLLSVSACLVPAAVWTSLSVHTWSVLLLWYACLRVCFLSASFTDCRHVCLPVCRPTYLLGCLPDGLAVWLSICLSA